MMYLWRSLCTLHVPTCTHMLGELPYSTQVFTVVFVWRLSSVNELHFCWFEMFSFSEWRRGKHGSEKVKNHPKNLAKEACSTDRGLRTRKYGTESFQASKRIRVRVSHQMSFPMSWAPLCPITYLFALDFSAVSVYANLNHCCCCCCDLLWLKYNDIFCFCYH